MRRRRDEDEQGFTLIELMITVVILPLVVGGIAFALVAVLSLQGGVSNRISDSADAQTVSATLNQDIASATLLTTSSTATQCGNPATQTQLLGLEWSLNALSGAYQNVVPDAYIHGVHRHCRRPVGADRHPECQQYGRGSQLDIGAARNRRDLRHHRAGQQLRVHPCGPPGRQRVQQPRLHVFATTDELRLRHPGDWLVCAKPLFREPVVVLSDLGGGASVSDNNERGAQHPVHDQFLP
jgi:prepilin-type N-terminal cleavage/methylation domain-containing protein